jgi:hypothetical protein
MGGDDVHHRTEPPVDEPRQLLDAIGASRRQALGQAGEAGDVGDEHRGREPSTSVRRHVRARQMATEEKRDEAVQGVRGGHGRT